MNTYHINIFFSHEDNGFIADIPDLNACSAFGDTPDKALSEVLIAQKLWLETAKNNGNKIPKPLYKPAIYQVG
jgi:predicted RNase H-like HicB family nuclease